VAPTDDLLAAFEEHAATAPRHWGNLPGSWTHWGERVRRLQDGQAVRVHGYEVALTSPGCGQGLAAAPGRHDQPCPTGRALTSLVGDPRLTAPVV
jgi:hypothetical protein